MKRTGPLAHCAGGPDAAARRGAQITSPGFISASGSNARLRRCIAAISTSLREQRRRRRSG
ncbi:hypothetical protein [Burkholderia pyrrocinia]|uniref:hypothetical protein n=1 Tax=Burkholderia pyrrocinia TaxID=60550 RepID=UPI001BCF8F06|nr:hypothetical protein [Burkholderia pyrrocinia]QVN22148.1 hypothetical protein JYG32_22550 [Burkholderia pyrrocinia]